MIRVIELFSGIGCQREALKDIPHELVGVSEIDKHCIKSYEAIHGKTFNFGDISKIESLPKVDLLTYSFPCQSISLCGKKEGLSESSNTKSALLWQVKRILYNCYENGTLPSSLVMENVKNLLSKKIIPDFKKFCLFLESIGYTNSYKVLNAKDYGVAQDRKRVFMVSSLNGTKFEFPDPIGCDKVLSDYLEKNVDEKYFMKNDITDKITYVNNRYIQYNVNEKVNNSQAHRIYFEDTYSFTLSATGTKCGGKIATTISEMTTSASFWKTYRSILNGNIFVDVYKLNNQNKSSINVVGADYLNGKIQQTSRIRGVDGLSSTIPASSVSDNTKIIYRSDIDKNIVFRNLTPLETWRLMGWKDESFQKAKDSGVSDYQLYKQAGNGIVVPVLESIFKKIFSFQ